MFYVISLLLYKRFYFNFILLQLFSLLRPPNATLFDNKRWHDRDRQIWTNNTTFLRGLCYYLSEKKSKYRIFFFDCDWPCNVKNRIKYVNLVFFEKSFAYLIELLDWSIHSWLFAYILHLFKEYNPFTIPSCSLMLIEMLKCFAIPASII